MKTMGIWNATKVKDIKITRSATSASLDRDVDHTAIIHGIVWQHIPHCPADSIFITMSPQISILPTGF